MNHRQIFKEDSLNNLLNGIHAKTDAERIAETKNELVNSSDFDGQFEWLFPDSTTNFEKLNLAYRGFCAYSLSLPNFLIRPANPNIGVLHFNNNFYVFSSKEAAYLFARNMQQ